MPACKNCRWYKPEENKPSGYCRRFPPQSALMAGKCVQMWSLVQEIDWCGEFQDKQPSGNPGMEVI